MPRSSATAGPGSRTARSTPSPWPAGSCATKCPTASSAPSPSACASTTSRAIGRSTMRSPPATSSTCSSSGPGRWGVTGLDDLAVLPKMAGHAQAAKLRLTEDLPREPGVYVFRSRSGSVLYVGKATNLRSRVRSYFSTDERRKVGQLLRETARIDHRVCRNGLEAAVLELRLIHRHRPRFNRQGTRSHRYPYVKLTLNERFPPAVGGANGEGRRRALPGPRLLVEAGEAHRGGDRDGFEGAPLHRPVRPTRRMPRRAGRRSSAWRAARARGPRARTTTGASSPTSSSGSPAAPTCSCRRSTPSSRRSPARNASKRQPTCVTGPRRCRAPSAAAGGSICCAGRGGSGYGSATRGPRSTAAGSRPLATPPISRACSMPAARRPPTSTCRPTHHRPHRRPGCSTRGPLPVPDRAEADELLCIVAWLEEHADRVRLEAVDGELSEPLPRVPSFGVRGRSFARRTLVRSRVSPTPDRRASAPSS